MIRIFNEQHITVHTKRCCQCWSSQQRAQQDTVVCCNGRYIQHQAWGQKENNLPLNDAVSPSCLRCIKILNIYTTEYITITIESDYIGFCTLYMYDRCCFRCVMTCNSIQIVALLLLISCNRMYKLMRELKERYKVNRSNVI